MEMSTTRSILSEVAKKPVEPLIQSLKALGFQATGSEITAGAQKTWLTHPTWSQAEIIKNLGLKKIDLGSYVEYVKTTDAYSIELQGNRSIFVSRFRRGQAGQNYRAGMDETEIHVRRDWEPKPRMVRRPRTVELSRLAPPSEMPQLGDRVKAPWNKRATVIRDPAVDRIVKKIEPFLGDTEGGSEAENCWTLAIDAAHEVGYDGEMGIRVAKAACRQLGYPRK